jgi:protoporphyrinogen oxidase
MSRKKAVIIGAGPAGLTAALELLEKTDIIPVIYEESGRIGGISCTINYQGNKIDIGGHRFFSKSEKIISWWKKILPLQAYPAKDDILLKKKVLFEERNSEAEEGKLDPEKTDKVMLIRNRISRIFFLSKFFDYPISLNLSTICNLGLKRMFKIGFSYIKIKFFPIKKERNLEDFFINRFGKELYHTFFKDYTEKVWGVSCLDINADWGVQRVKGLSVSKAVFNFFKKLFHKDRSLNQKSTESSLISQFMYPKHGPGQLWQEVAEKIIKKGGEIHLNHEVFWFKTYKYKISEIIVKDKLYNKTFGVFGDYYLSSMAIKDLVCSMECDIPDDVRETAEGLLYRDFITVGLLLKKMKIKNNTAIKTFNNIVPDTWIYVQENNLKLGRIQVFNNWSPYMVQDINNVWLGLEYFCNEGDNLWNKNDNELRKFAVSEMVKAGMVDEKEVIDSTVIKCRRAYPAYFGTYEKIDLIKNFVNSFENLYVMGRNGMHRYNNMDHSMLTAMAVVEDIINQGNNKREIWNINTEKLYHEEDSGTNPSEKFSGKAQGLNY